MQHKLKVKNTMKAQVINLTPELAAQYLTKNLNNRDLSAEKVKEYSNALLQGHWKENGEPIILDKNGVVKNGQHRLKAVIDANKGYKTVLVTDVSPDVMHTIDTGKNRSLSDMLKLQGYKNPSILAGTVKSIISFENNRGALASSGRGTKTVTNTIGLEYIKSNQQNLEALTTLAASLYKKSNSRVLPVTRIAFYMHLLNGYRIDDNVVLFIKNLIGINMYEGNAASWVYGKLYKAKQDKVGLNSRWLAGVIIKSWNMFNSGDSPVTYIKYNIENPLPEIERVYMPKFA